MMLSRGQSRLALLALFVKPSHQWVNYYSSSLDEPCDARNQRPTLCHWAAGVLQLP